MTQRSLRSAAVVLTCLMLVLPVGSASATKTAAPMSPALISSLASAGAAEITAFVTYRDAAAAQRSLATLRAGGLRVVGQLRSINAVAVRGTGAQIRRLASDPTVQYLDGEQPLEYFGGTGIWATRVGSVRTASGGGPFRDGSGAILTGTGIGVGIVDSGVDASHPDLISRVATNVKMATGTSTPRGTNTDSTSGHGTHVSGIVAGDGTASQGTFTGVAPGSTLHVFAAGEGLNVLFASAALDRIYTRYNTFSPRIRVVNSSWGNPAGSAYNPDGTIEKIVNKLVTDKGVLMVFTAGNAGGTGSSDMTSSYCKDPTPGVVCVANYDDNESGDRDFALDDTSSRGKSGTEATYPDISAPGSFITSTFQPTSGALYGSFVSPEPAWAPYYGNAGGTSMAAPHTAGIAALLLQARPALTPSQVEDILLDTAHKFTAGAPYVADPQNSGQTTSFDKGSGLIDAVAALGDPRVAVTGDGAASPATLVAADGDDYPGFGAADIVSATAVPDAAGVTFSMTVADASDRPSTLQSIGLRVLGNFAGRTIRSTVNLTPAGSVVPTAAESPDNPATAEATSATIAGNTITFFVPYAELRDPPAGSVAHNVWFASYAAVIQDLAPSPAAVVPPTPADLLVRPLYTAPFTLG